MTNLYARSRSRTRRQSTRMPEYLAGGRVRFAGVVPCQCADGGWRWTRVFNVEKFQRKFSVVGAEAA